MNDFITSPRLKKKIDMTSSMLIEEEKELNTTLTPETALVYEDTKYCYVITYYTIIDDTSMILLVH